MKSKTKELIKTFIIVLLVPFVLKFARKLMGLAGIQIFHGDMFKYAASETWFAVLAIIAMILLGRTDSIKPKMTGIGEGLKAGTYMIVMTVISLLAFLLLLLSGQASIIVGSADILAFFLFALMVGVTEEVLYRALIQNALHDYFGEDSYEHIRIAIILSGIFFGLIHLGNIFSGESLSGTLYQVLGVIPLGIIMGAMYYRSHRNLWVNIILHAVYDASGLLAGGVLGGKGLVNALEGADSPKTLIIVAIGLAVGLFVSRRKKIPVQEQNA